MTLRQGRFLLFTLVPTLAMLGYLLLLAQPTYETEAKLIVRENQGASDASVPGSPSTLGSKSSFEDAVIIENYIHSAAFIEKAAERFDLRNHFHDAPSDPFRRLDQNAPSETFYEFFRKAVSIRVTPESSILTVRVRAFSPAIAQQLAQFIIERSEETINNLNERMTGSHTTLAEQKLVQAQKRLMEARENSLQFQVAHPTVDPAGGTSTDFENVASLDSRVAAPEIQRLHQDMNTLEEQREDETRLRATGRDAGLNDSLVAYENLKMQEEFALAAYSSAFTIAENAKLEASRQKKFLLVIAPPHIPEKPASPRPARSAATVFVLSCIGYGIFRLILATIRDHTI